MYTFTKGLMATTLDTTTYKLQLIAAHQTVSPTTEQLLPQIGADDTCPSIDLFQEKLWDATESLDLTEEEVQELGIWTANRFLKVSQGRLADLWSITRKQAEVAIRKYDRLMENPKKTEEADLMLAVATALCFQ